jgi:hypothetical protein
MQPPISTNDEAFLRVVTFARRFGEHHATLAMHAALPLGLTPELVHLLRVNFVSTAPWIAEADLLLSPLCHEVGGDLYEMEPQIRELLLEELSADPAFGKLRIAQVAEFLLAYAGRSLQTSRVAQQSELHDFLTAQQWAALAYLQPQAAAESLAYALDHSVKTSDHSATLRVATIAQHLAAPLFIHDQFLLYAASAGQAAAGNQQRALTWLDALGPQDRGLTVGNVSLPAPRELVQFLGIAPGAAEPVARTTQHTEPQPIEQAPSRTSSTLQRYLHVEFPRTVGVGTRAVLTIALRLKPSSTQESATILTIDDPPPHEVPPTVKVVVRAPGFDNEGPDSQMVLVPRDTDSAPVRYVLRPHTDREHTIRVDFYQHDRQISTAALVINVLNKPLPGRYTVIVGTLNVREGPGTAFPVALGQGSVLARGDIIELDNIVEGQRIQDNIWWAHLKNQLGFISMSGVAPAPEPSLREPAAVADLVLTIQSERRDGSVLHFFLHSNSEEIGYHHAPMGFVRLEGTPLERMQSVYAELSRLTRRVSPNDLDFVQPRLARLGNTLWDELFPPELKQVYWQIRERARTLLIISDESWIPWEIVKPFRFDEGNKRLDDQHLCDRFLMGRWLSGPAFPATIAVQRIQVITPPPGTLPWVEVEADYFRSLAESQPGLIIYTLIGDRAVLLRLFAENDFDILHLTAHGSIDAHIPDNAGIMLADGVLRPSDLSIRSDRVHGHALVSINACHGSRSEYPFTGIGSWAERLVRDMRLGALIGTAWEVDERLAQLFTNTFYEAILLQGRTLGEGISIARKAIRAVDPANATWLSYVLYGDPNTRIVVATPPESTPDSEQATTAPPPSSTQQTDAPTQRSKSQGKRVKSMLRSVKQLIRKLSDPDHAVRLDTIKALGATGDREAVQPILEALNDPSKRIRGAAAQALGQLQDTAAVPALISALSDVASEVRGAAAEALGQLQAEEAVPALIDLLADTKRSTQKYRVGARRVYDVAAEALERIGTPEALTALARWRHNQARSSA